MGDIDSTIAALSTPPGESGLAVIRMSGSEALPILSSIFTSKLNGAFKGEWEHKRFYHGTIRRTDHDAVDDVVCTVMKGPDSYTGEDVVEISCHGNMLIVEAILSLLFRKGARAAEAGEFTKRAFLNGKMDLIQAEAVCDLIHARSELQRKVAHEQLRGTLSERINALADEMVTLLADVETNIDFIEEDVDVLDRPGALCRIGTHRRSIEALLESAAFSRPFREGYRIAITGPVNAGKSSLFNRLLGESRAIVTEIPGTTRDVLREPMVFDGLVFLFYDMAGLRGETGDRIEAIGIQRAEDTAISSDLVLFVVDGSIMLGTDVAERIRRLDSSRTMIILNKIDLPEAITPAEIAEQFPGYRVATTSALTGEGLQELKSVLVTCVGREGLEKIARDRVVLNARLIHLLEKAKDGCRKLGESLRSETPLELLAVEVREIISFYEEATGRRYSDDLLENIFTRFCIGK